jgi:hypothetical protein
MKKTQIKVFAISEEQAPYIPPGAESAHHFPSVSKRKHIPG